MLIWLHADRGQLFRMATQRRLWLHSREMQSKHTKATVHINQSAFIYIYRIYIYVCTWLFVYVCINLFSVQYVQRTTCP